MNRTRRFVAFWVVVACDPDCCLVGLRRIAGEDLGTPEWSCGRRLAVHPALDRLGWRVTDVATGSSVCVGSCRSDAIARSRDLLEQKSGGEIARALRAAAEQREVAERLEWRHDSVRGFLRQMRRRKDEQVEGLV